MNDLPKRLRPEYEYFVRYSFNSKKGNLCEGCGSIRTPFAWTSGSALEGVRTWLKKENQCENLVIISWQLLVKPTLKQHVACWIYNLLCKIEKWLGL